MIYIISFKENGQFGLPIGSLSKTENGYSVYGTSPIGEKYTKKIETVGGYRRVFEDENDKKGHLVDESYEMTYYTSILTPDELISVLLKLIDETSVTIDNSEFFLNSPIVTTGVAKVILSNCVAHIEGGDGFIDISGAFKGGKIFNNYISPVKYHKYGSQNKKDLLLKKPYYPSNTEYHIKVNKEDKVITSKTDKRGYPSSCGVDNKDKDVIVIIRGEKEYITVSQLNEMIKDAQMKGVKEIPITKQIRLENSDKLNEENITLKGE